MTRLRPKWCDVTRVPLYGSGFLAAEMVRGASIRAQYVGVY